MGVDAETGHVAGGNCWKNVHACQKCGRGNLCDGCHKHEEPRGDCDQCPRCPECDKDIEQ